MRFLFCDKILEMEPGKRALSRRVTTIGDEFLTEHYSRKPLMPATLVLECLAQLGGWLYIITEKFGVNTVLALVQGVEVFQHPQPGDTLVLEVWLQFTHRDGATLRGEARIREEIILRVQRLMLAGERAKPEDIARYKDMFSYISGGFVLDQGAKS